MSPRKPSRTGILGLILVFFCNLLVPAATFAASPEGSSPVTQQMAVDWNRVPDPQKDDFLLKLVGTLVASAVAGTGMGALTAILLAPVAFEGLVIAGGLVGVTAGVFLVAALKNHLEGKLLEAQRAQGSPPSITNPSPLLPPEVDREVPASYEVGLGSQGGGAETGAPSFEGLTQSQSGS